MLKIKACDITSFVNDGFKKTIVLSYLNLITKMKLKNTLIKILLGNC